MWDTWPPRGWYVDEEYAATAAAFDNDDWSDVTLHSRRHRWGHAPGDPYYANDAATLHPAPVLDVPTLVLHGEAETVNLPGTSEDKEQFFHGLYQRMLLPDVGHFPQREAAETVARERLQFLGAPGTATVARQERGQRDTTSVWQHRCNECRAMLGRELNRSSRVAAQVSGFSCCSRVGTSSLTVGWMCMAREITV